jgi:4-hydroxybenzoate polyprenyltransferase
MLAGSANRASLLILCAGCTLLYLGGMYLNDAFDAGFDSRFRPERPIPSKRISRKAVTLLGSLWMAGGVLILLPSSHGWAVALAGLILVYNALHKRTAMATFIMAGCRVLIYPLAGAAAGLALPEMPWTLWAAALSMGLWILVLSLLARTESGPAIVRKGVAGLLAAPLVVETVVHGRGAWIAGLVLALWIGRCLLVLRGEPRPQKTVADLLAGIPLVDLLAVSPPLGMAYVPYLAFTLLALALRRGIPPS